jgi:hypothetical protein
MAGELGAAFSLPEALHLGLVPGVRAAPDPDAALAAYVSLYLREEVQAERLVRNVGDFARFLEAISFSHGAQLNVANVARECEVGRKTVEGYVSVLEDLLIAERLPPFTKRARRALATHPKLYYFDAGVYRSIRPSGPLDRPEEIEGAALEGLVWQHLRAWRGWGRPAWRELAFWRTRRGSEVDFVLESERELAAIEVKNAARVREADLRSLVRVPGGLPGSTGRAPLPRQGALGRARGALPSRGGFPEAGAHRRADRDRAGGARPIRQPGREEAPYPAAFLSRLTASRATTTLLACRSAAIATTTRACPRSSSSTPCIPLNGPATTTTSSPTSM